MPSDCGSGSKNPPIFSPASDMSALLFALLPCVREPFLPLFRFLFLFLELSGQNFSGFTVPPVNSSPKELLDTVFPDKDTLLNSLTFYGTLFHVPLLHTLSGLLQAFRFYDSYKDIFAGFSSGFGEMSPDALTGLMGMFSSDSGNNGNSTGSLNSGNSGNNMISGNRGNFSDNINNSEIKDDINSSPKPSPEQENDSNDAPAPSLEQENDSLFQNLYKMLTPEQQEIYEKLMQE